MTFPNPDELEELDTIPPQAPDEEQVDDRATEPPPPPATLHHLELICQGCEVRARLNDLPIAHLVGDDPDQAEWLAPPINPYLVGHENLIELAVTPLGEPEDPRASLAAARVELAVRVHAKGAPVAPGAGDAILDVAVHDELRRQLAELDPDEPVILPIELFFQFDNEGPSFADELETAPEFDDADALRDYAIRLRDLAASRDAAGLTTEMEPKIQAYMLAYDEPRQPFYDSLFTGFRDQLLPEGVRADFERDDVELTACCGGRLWELQRPGGAPLLETEPDEEGSTKHMRVLVGPRDGGLRIVR